MRQYIYSCDRTKLATAQQLSTFLLEIMTLVSSANMGSHKEFMLRGRSFMYIMNSKVSVINLWGTPYFNVF
jgi:hypothetical protein